MEKITFDGDYTLNDSFGDYNSLERLHKKLMRLKREYEQQRKERE